MWSEDGVFRDAEGRVVPPQGPRPRRQVEAAWWVPAEGNRPGWDGLPIAYELCVDALA